jgi:2,3-bisphosphoglycerate-dependent phosphoglycerate mutase
LSARAVAAVRDRDAAVGAEHGDDAVWLAVSHGDVVKAVLADALGMHLDAFQRIVVDPASLSVVRYSPSHTFVLTMNSTAGTLAWTRPATRRRRAGRSGVPRDDAVVGGGAGSTS